jgi:hypothetical protein
VLGLQACTTTTGHVKILRRPCNRCELCDRCKNNPNSVLKLSHHLLFSFIPDSFVLLTSCHCFLHLFPFY